MYLGAYDGRKNETKRDQIEENFKGGNHV